MKFLRKLSKKENAQLIEGLGQMGQEFPNREEAEAHYFQERDKDLKDVKDLEVAHPGLALDLTGESLSRLEEFFFNCFVDRKIKIDIPRERMEQLITQYTREVFVANKIASWIVFENEFSEGRYEIGLDYGNGEGTNQDFGSGLDEKDKSEKRKYLSETFKAYMPE